jgi:hypothetical protein
MFIEIESVIHRDTPDQYYIPVFLNTDFIIAIVDEGKYTKIYVQSLNETLYVARTPAGEIVRYINGRFNGPETR